MCKTAWFWHTENEKCYVAHSESEGAWPALDPVQKYCGLQLEKV